MTSSHETEAKKRRNTMRPVLLWTASILLSAGLAVALIACWGLAVYGSALAVPALARGAVVLAEPASNWAGELPSGERTRVSFVLTNLTAQPVWINGMRANCTCVSQADALPLELPARGRRRLGFWVRPTDAQVGQPFAQPIELYLSVPGPRPSLAITGYVTAHAGSPGMPQGGS